LRRSLKTYTTNYFKFNEEIQLGRPVPNVWVSLRILLTMPVSVPVVRNFFQTSKQTYLISCMSHDRLSSAATHPVKNTIAQTLVSPNWRKLLQTLKRERSSFIEAFLST
jgi:flagellar biosynthesis protein FliP